MPAKHFDNLTAFLRTAAFYLVALALLIWAAMDVYNRYQFYQNNGNSQQTEPAESSKTGTLTINNTRPIASQYLFGKKTAVIQKATVTLAPATRLNLKLIGVIATSEDGVSKVIIQIGGSNVDVYSVGDQLPEGNATIEKIEATQVLLRRNGKLESLAIIRPELEEENELPE